MGKDPPPAAAGRRPRFPGIVAQRLARAALEGKGGLRSVGCEGGRALLLRSDSAGLLAAARGVTISGAGAAPRRRRRVTPRLSAAAGDEAAGIRSGAAICFVS